MTTQERLNDAEEQYHLIMTGSKARVYVDQNGERIEYTSTTVTRLLQYIESLKVQLGQSSVGSGGSGSVRGVF
jgi:hypothetical protein